MKEKLPCSEKGFGPFSPIKKLLLLFAFLATQFGVHAQTLISPTGDGGFELGTTFAANGWTELNSGANLNRSWWVGTGQAGYTGSRSAFIGNSATTVGANGSARINHFYKSVTFPAGATNIVLTFKYKQAVSDLFQGALYDYISVYLNTAAPTTNTIPAAGRIFGPYPSTGVTSYTTQTVSLPNSLAGTTQVIDFMWVGDAVTPNGYGAVDDISLTYTPFVPSVAPNCATGFSPADLATNVARNATLTWTATPNATSYDVYAGTSSTPSLLANVTTNSYTPPSNLAANTTYYYKIVPKNVVGSPAGCSTQSFTTGNGFQYCTPTYANGAGTVDIISKVVLGTLTNTSGASVAPYYTFYNAVTVPNIGQGNTATVAVTMGDDTTQFAGAWIDFNQNGSFEPGEGVVSSVTSGANGTTNLVFNVPAGAVLGNTRLRVRGGDDVAMTTSQACGATNDPYGETEDYVVNVVPGLPTTQCATLNSPANAATNVTNFTLSWTAPASGPVASSYDVYLGTTASPGFFANVTATSIVITGYASNTTYYWKIVPKSALGVDNTSCTVRSFTTGNPFLPYCNTGVTYTTNVEPITLVNFAGINRTSSATVDGTPALENYIADVANVTSANSYNITLKGNTAGAFTSYFTVFVDWNQDGDLNDANEIYPAGSVTNSTGADAIQAVTSIMVPEAALAGTTRMRVKKLYGSSAPNPNNPCTGGGYGQSEDYTINVTACTPSLWYADTDNDTFGNPSVSLSACLQPAGYVANNSDCDDANNAIHQTFPFYVDADQDTYGVGSLVAVCAVNATTPPTGYSVNNTDCDDANAATYQSASLFTDADGDGYTVGASQPVCYGATIPAGYSVTSNGEDCNDNSNTAYQSAMLFVDFDGDGYTVGAAQSVCYGATIPAGYSVTSIGEDCNDNSNTAYQSALLFVDFDGDGYTVGAAQPVCYGATIPSGYTASSNGEDCDDANNAIHQTFQFYTDNDGDTYGAGSLVDVCAVDANTPPTGYALNNTDCNDGNNTVYQNATLYVDADNDGYTNGTSETVCYGAALPSGYVVSLTAIDCNDSVAAIHPNAVEVPYNGVDDDCDNVIDETGTVTTTLLSSSCGVTLTSIQSLVGIQTVGGHNITGYRIRITNGAQVQVIEKNVPHFTIPQFPSYAYATTYAVDIQLQRSGIWQASWGASCLVSTPAILEEGGAAAVSPSQCGLVLPKINTLIATSSIAGVTGYRFRVTNLTDANGPNAVQTIDRTQNWFSLQMLTRHNFGTTYRIEVSVKTTGTFGGFGAPCEVSSPAAPSLINCGGTIASGTTTVAATSVQGATQYRFQITRVSDNASATIDKNSNWFIFNSVPASVFTPGVAYSVRVAVMTTGTWSPFGDACEITSPGTTAKGISTDVAPMADAAVQVAAYPNPFTADFAVDVTTSSKANVTLNVYDMLGKLMESREVNIEDMEMQKVGSQYPSGVYNVVVRQDGVVKTLRVIKR